MQKSELKFALFYVIKSAKNGLLLVLKGLDGKGGCLVK